MSSTVLLVEIKRVGCTGKALCCVKHCATGRGVTGSCT